MKIYILNDMSFLFIICINYLSSPSFMMVVTFFSYKYIIIIIIIIIIFTPPFFYHHGRRRYSFYLPRYLSFIVSSCDCDDYLNFLKYIIIITIIFIFFLHHHKSYLLFLLRPRLIKIFRNHYFFSI
jgi:hypothetical protein